MKKLLTFILLFAFVATLLGAQVYKDPGASVDARVNDLLSRMTLKEKLGQMVQAEKLYVVSGDLANYCIGSLLSGGDSAAPAPNSVNEWATMYDNFQRDAMNGRLAIPMIYGADGVHGFGNMYGSTVFPHNIGLGAACDPDLMEAMGKIVAREMAAAGVDMTFGPCLTVPRDERWGRTYEGFGESPEIHKKLAARYVLGLQGANMSGGEFVLACAKHWVADGGTANGTDQGNATITEQVLRDIHIAPYIPAIQAGVGSVMPSYSSWNGAKCTGNKYLITDVLKTELGFKGFVISDYNAIDQLPGTFREQVKAAALAGVDMFMEPKAWKDVITNLESLVNANEVPLSRVDDAVKRILIVKFRLGLFEKPYSDSALRSTVGSDAHRAVAREAVRKSLVLLKNDTNTLPLTKAGGTIFVAGKSADDIGIQCGGWTISWQGASGNTTKGTTILAGIKAAVANSGTTVTYNKTGTGAAGARVAIVVIGELPYAEGKGYSSTLALSTEDVTCINNVAASGVPMVIVLVSGRPLIIADYLSKCKAFVEAWLPGTEGQGVADVLFGDYNFTGKLPCSWPRTISQVPINVGDANYDPLFAYGFGLSYATAGLVGDANGDNTVNILDALVTAQKAAGLNPSPFNAANADVNKDNKVDILDALLIARYAAGLITTF